MHRTQVSLTEQQMDALRRRSAATGKSIAAIIREAVDQQLADSHWEARKRRALAAVGRFDLGGDLAAQHDDVFAESILDEWREPSDP